jgi:hypothetical protein
MKAVTLFAVASTLLLGLNAAAQETCDSASDGQPVADAALVPSDSAQPLPSAQEVMEFLSQSSPATASSGVAAPSIASSVASQPVPAARIRVIDPASLTRPSSSPSGVGAAREIPTARIRVLDGTLASKPKVKAPEDTEAQAATADAEAAVIAATTPEASLPIDPALARLVGTWKAVARQGDGELTTVELQLDDRGWARFTVPGADGKPSTIKRRAELNGDELNLTGADASLLLGKLIEVNDRQMVLARAEGKLTFVRPR